MIQLSNSDSEMCFPEGPSNDLQLRKTTHLGIGAHQDDLEILAIHGILEAYDNPELYFTGVTVTDGRSAPRSGLYTSISDDELWEIRCSEQKKAAEIGRYNAQFLLNYPSQQVKSTDRQMVIDDIKQILSVTSPSIIYTHNPVDKHETHVSVLLCVLQALRELTPPLEGVKLYGCEVWRGLDWLCDEDKIALDVSRHVDLQTTLLKAFDSQTKGGKRYDLATMGRRSANATYDQSHQTNTSDGITYAMDLTLLIQHPEMDISSFVNRVIQNLANDVTERLNRLRKETG